MRIGEDEPLPLPETVLAFEGPEGPYRLHLRPGPPHGLEVETGDLRESWNIERAEINGGVVTLSGMARPARGVIDDHAWFDLTLGDGPAIEYWGDRVLMRRDTGRRSTPAGRR